MHSSIEAHEKKFDTVEPPKLSAWLWRPWYAKLWWGGMPFWWLGMAASSSFEEVEAFYRGGIAGYLNLLFFPMTALMILGVGYVRKRLDSFLAREDGAPLCHEEDEAFIQRRRIERDYRTLRTWQEGFNPADPRFGALWIGNPMNPTNPGHINPHTGKFNAS